MSAAKTPTTGYRQAGYPVYLLMPGMTAEQPNSGDTCTILHKVEGDRYRVMDPAGVHLDVTITRRMLDTHVSGVRVPIAVDAEPVTLTLAEAEALVIEAERAEGYAEPEESDAEVLAHIRNTITPANFPAVHGATRVHDDGSTLAAAFALVVEPVDPEPWANGEGSRKSTADVTDDDRLSAEGDERFYFRPRSSVELNPIMVEFEGDPFFADRRERAANYLEVNLSDMSPEAIVWHATPEQIAEARAELQRIAGVSA
jgi:hypothetical protein